MTKATLIEQTEVLPVAPSPVPASPLPSTEQIAPIFFIALPLPTYRALDAEAKRRGLPLSRLLDEAVQLYMRQTEATQPNPKR